MKVELVGTGSIYSDSNSACTLVDEELIIDFPNGILKSLLKTNHNIEKIDKILITHFHGDHTADIPFFLLYKYRFLQSNKKSYIIGPSGIEKIVKDLFYGFKLEYDEKIKKKVNYIEIEKKELIDAYINYKIENIEVKHSDTLVSYGYVINEKLGITGDTILCDGVEKIVKKSKVVIADCSNIKGNLTHMGIDNLEYLIQKYNKKIIPTHIKTSTRVELINLNVDNIFLQEDGYQFEI